MDLILDQAPAPPTLRSLRSLRLSSPSDSCLFVKFVSKSWFFNGVQRHAGSAFFAVKQPPKFALIREIRVKVPVFKSGPASRWLCG